MAVNSSDDGHPIYVFLIGNSPSKYLELTIQAVKYVKRNVKNSNIGLIGIPGSEDLTQVVVNRLKEINPNADTKNIHWIRGTSHFDDWDNTQRIFDIESFTEEFDPIIFLDSDSVLMHDVSKYVKEFIHSGKKYGFINGYMSYKAFDEKWEGPQYIPSTTIQFYRSAAVGELFPVWKNQWKTWIEPAPFVDNLNPARFYKYSKIAIGQYSLSKALQELNSLDTDVYEIPRPSLKLVRNLAVDVQKSKRKFLGAGSSYSNDGPGRIKLKVKKGKINEGVGEDTYVEVKVGDSDRNTKTISGTEPVWNHQFLFEDAPIYGAADKIMLTLWNNPKPIPQPKARAFAGPYSGVARVTLDIISGVIHNKHDVVGEDDPYIKISIGGVEKQTNHATNTNTPSWNETVIFDDVESDAAQNITVTAWDWDRFTKHDLIGTATLNLLPFQNTKQHVSVTLFGEDGKEEGSVELDALVTPADSGSVSARSFGGDGGDTADTPAAPKEVIGTGSFSLLDRKTHDPEADPTSVTVSVVDEDGVEKATVDVEASFYVAVLPKEAEEEPPKTRNFALAVGGAYSGRAEVSVLVVSSVIYNKHDVFGEDDPYVKISIGGVEKQTAHATNTNTPTWNETLTFTDVVSDDAQNVTITIWDWDKFTKHDLIGTATLNLLPFNNNKQHVTVSIIGGENNTEEATLELEALVKPVFS